MNTFEYTILGGTVCGIVMVMGGIFLLYKGAIKLDVASKDPSLTLEIFKNEFKLTTHAPALGLFVIGFLFVGSAIFFGQEMAATPIELKAKTGVIDEEVKVFVRSEWVVPTVRGAVHHVLRPYLDVFWVTISAPGYEPHTASFSRENTGQFIDFGDVKLKRLFNRPEPNEENIFELPPGMKPPPLTEGGGF